MTEKGINSKKKLYLAAPLFSESELKYNIDLKSILSPYFEVFLPQEDGELILNLIKKGVSKRAAANEIFNSDIKAIEGCDIILVVLDGRVIDEGAAFELGLAFALGKKCVGFQTDIRRLLPIGNNPMIDCALEITLTSIEELLDWAKTQSSSEITDKRKNLKLFSEFNIFDR
jgi:nucleoside 2-deoxyribosyltransferase